MSKEATIEEKKVTTEGEPRICGIMYDHGDGNYSLGEGIALTKDEENTVQEIFEEHINEGCGYFGTKKDIAEQLLEVQGNELGNKTLTTPLNKKDIMIVNAYLKVTAEQWKEIKEKYVEPNMYHIVSDSKRKKKRCDACGAYCPCSSYEGFCMNEECLVDGNGTCEDWHE